MKEIFPCNSCGACCKSVQLSKLTANLDRGDGTCRHFDDAQNTCLIYDTRPDICNVQHTYESHYKEIISWEKFIVLNQIACAELLKKQAT